MAWVFIALWVLWLLLLASSLWPGLPDASRARRRLGSSLALATAAWSGVALGAGRAGMAFASAIAIGMSFGLVGDLFMARRNTPAGMAAFALNHAAYWAAFLTLARGVGHGRPELLAPAVLLWMVVGVVVWRQTAGSGTSRLRFPALIYTLLLAGTAGLGLGLALGAPRLFSLALGGALFFVSDALIAGRIFRGLHRPHLNDVIWLTYGPAQMLIVYTLVLLPV